MGVGSGQTRVGDLVFQVFGRTLHPEWFGVRAHRRYAQAGWLADVRILAGGGHLVLWSCGGTRLAEVLTGPDVVLPEPAPLFCSPVRQERSTRLRPGGGQEYQACFSAERLDGAVFAHLADELAIDPGRGVLIHRSHGSNRLAAAALSRIEVQARPNGLSVQAFHTFPDERAIVRTQSLLEVRAGS